MRYVFIIPIVLLLAACHNQVNEKEQVVAPNQNNVSLSPAQSQLAAIELGELQQRLVSGVLKVSGMIDVPPQNLVSVSVPLGGYIKSTRLLPGMGIRKGDLLAIVEDQQYIRLQEDYLIAKEKARLGKAEYERQKELNETKSISDKVYQQAESEYNTQRILIRSLSEKLRLAGINPDKLSEENISRSVNIYSPLNGFVSKVNVNVGKYVAASDVLFELVDPHDIHLSLKVFERDLDKIFAGQELIAYTNNVPEKKYRCEVLLVGQDISEDRTAEIHCHFETYDKSLVPGTYMNAELEVRNNKSWSLPEAAVLRYENNYYVFTEQAKDQYSMIPVDAGNTENGYIEIRNPDLLFRKKIVVKGAYTLLMMVKNQPEEE